MDIEPPHHPIESKRDFFIHLFTITCGLLIALSLEAVVEWGHHRALVREARENVRQELTENLKAANENLSYTAKSSKTIEDDLVTERRLQAHPKDFKGSLSFTFNWNSPNDSAWTTARDTGALSYMPYAEVQRYAGTYELQAEIEKAEDEITEDDARAYAHIASVAEVDTMEHDEAQRLIDATALAKAHLEFLKQLTTQLRDQYKKTLDAK